MINYHNLSKIVLSELVNYDCGLTKASDRFKFSNGSLFLGCITKKSLKSFSNILI